MENEHVKRCSTSYIIKHSNRIALYIYQNGHGGGGSTKYQQGNSNSHSLLGECKMVQPLCMTGLTDRSRGKGADLSESGNEMECIRLKTIGYA